MSPIFRYKAIDNQGQRLKGNIVREDIQSAAFFLMEKGYHIIELKLKAEIIVELEKLINKVRIKDLATFCRQMATMVEAGLPLLHCLNVLAKQVENKQLKEGIKNIKNQVASGESLASAMTNCPNVFPELMVSMIRTGEIAGVLSEVLTRLAIKYEKEHILNEKIKTALTYPLFLLLVSITILIFLLVRVVPVFVQLFSNLELSLPLSTRNLLVSSQFVIKYWYLFFIFIICFFIIFKKFTHSELGNYATSKLLLSIPIIGDLVRKLTIARFSRTLATLLRCGIPILEALTAVEQTIGNKIIANSLVVAQANVSQGLSLAEQLGNSGVFPAMVIEMIAVGEETGVLDKMFDKVADFYEMETQLGLNRISSIIEPLMIIFMSLIVGWIISAIFLPIFDLIDTGF